MVAYWVGAWTFWDPPFGSIMSSFNCVRLFKALNEETSVIIHDNIGILRVSKVRGRSVNKTLRKKESFCHSTHRCSIILVYDKSNHLLSFGAICIRETEADSHTNIWTPSEELLGSFPLSLYNKDYFGVEKTFEEPFQKAGSA